MPQPLTLLSHATHFKRWARTYDNGIAFAGLRDQIGRYLNVYSADPLPGYDRLELINLLEAKLRADMNVVRDATVKKTRAAKRRRLAAARQTSFFPA